jgi:methyl-accepting chemotaxis protein
MKASLQLANLKVGMRLGFAFALMIALTLVIAFVSLNRVEALSTDLMQIVSDRQSKTALLQSIIDEANVMSRSVHNTLLLEGGERENDIKRADAAKRNISDMLEGLDKASGNEEANGRKLLQQVHDKTGAYMLNLVRFTRLVAGGKRDEARTLLGTTLGPELEAAFEAMRLLSKYHTEAMRVRHAKSYENARNLAVVLASISVALAVFVAIWITRGITRPLNEAVAVAGLVASGDLTSRVAARGGDETGQLLSALARMNGSLTTIVRDVRNSSEAIAVASEELVGGNADLQDRTEQQASSLEETAASVEQLTATVKQTAENARHASELARGASAVAGKGGKVVEGVVEKMGSINSSSKRIAEIIGVIDGIAFQTNILALNAAVEAARAGDHGRGFAVVATEVRNLAQRSAGAAKEIKALIDESVGNVDDGAKLVAQAHQTMAEIVTSIGKVTRIIEDISIASREQSLGIEEINRTLTGMEQVTQQNAALVEETAAAVEAMDLQTRSLVTTMSVFKLNSTGTGLQAGLLAADNQPAKRKPAAVEFLPKSV